MKRTITALSLISMVLLSSCAVPPIPTATAGPATAEAKQAQITAEILQVESDLNTTTDMKLDVEAAAPYFADEYMSIDGKGNVTNKADVLAFVKSGAYKGESRDFEKFRAHAYGDVAVDTFVLHLKGVFQGSKVEGRQYYTNVWVKRNGRWQLAAQHESDLEWHPQ